MLVGASLCGLWSLPAHAADVAVLHAENVSITLEDGSDVSQSNGGRKSALAATTDKQLRRLRFDAFGRRFALDVEQHDELNRYAAERGSSAVAMRGQLSGNTNSWVRLTQTGAKVQGLIWDGHELYAVEPAADLPAANKSSAGTVIFRLSDTKTEFGADACGAGSAKTNGASFYDHFRKEFTATKQDAQATSVSHRLLLSAITDASFERQFSSPEAAADAVVARINNVDGIFTSQLGVTVALTHTVPANSPIAERLSATTSADNLLTSLSRVRGSEAAFFGSGVTHLFTGRDLDGNTIGISYVGSVCSTSYGSTLSESRGRGAWIDSLIAAHELGHNFGASHDGSGECEDTPLTYLMSPSIAGWDRFSQCSVKRMRHHVETAACLVAVPKTDVAIAEDLGEYRASIDQEIAWSMSIANLGESTTQDVRLQIYVPAQLSIVEAIVNGACAVGAGVVDCVLNAMTPAEVRKVDLRLRSSSAGSFTITAAGSGSYDFDVTNNDGSGAVVVEATVSAPATPTGNSGTPLVADQPAEGGGGAWNWAWVSLFAAFAAATRRIRRQLAHHCVDPTGERSAIHRA